MFIVLHAWSIFSFVAGCARMLPTKWLALKRRQRTFSATSRKNEGNAVVLHCGVDVTICSITFLAEA